MTSSTAVRAAAFVRAGTWDLAFDFFGLDPSFQWDDARIVEQCVDYRECLKREAAEARELAAYRAVAARFAKAAA